MLNASETSATLLVAIAALGLLGWGFYRARPAGKLGILSWLQSVTLMVPWLLFFGLFAAGIYLNLVGILLLLIVSTGLYIFLGNRLRTARLEASLTSQSLRKTQEAQTQEETEPETERSGDSTPDSASAKEKSASAADQQPEILPIPDRDLQAIQEIFGIDTFFTTATIPYQEGAIFRGNLRGQPEEVHRRLSAGLEKRLGDRYRLFLVEGPEEKPIVIILPSRNDPKPSTLSQKLLAIGLLLATIATTLEAGGILMGFDFFSNLNRYLEVLPIALGIFAILGAHELGHRWLAQRYQIRLSPPFLIPAWQIGSFGALTRFESLLPNRVALFDLALAGPAASGLLSLLMLILGLFWSGEGNPFQIPSAFFQGSMLVGMLAKAILGSSLQQPLVPIHPLVAIGWLGLAITALNLMPAGQLDGGRMVQAIYGRKTAGRTTIATLLVLAIASLVNPLALYWAIVIIFLQRDLERPSLNELTEPDDARAAWALLALFLMIATLIPLTPSLAGQLGIGG